MRQVAPELPAIAEAGERICGRIQAALTEQRPVLRQRERHPDQHQPKRTRRESQPRDVQSQCCTADQHSERQPAERDWNEQPAITLAGVAHDVALEQCGQRDAYGTAENEGVGEVAELRADAEEIHEVGRLPGEDPRPEDRQ